jgi:curved DNA-binding protein CbpA
VYHPDRNQDNPEAEEMFVRIAKAYQAYAALNSALLQQRHGCGFGP